MRPIKPNEIRRIKDPSHPDGYREWVGRNILAQRFEELCAAPGPKRCYVCHGEFTTWDGPTLEHIIPKGAGGSTHNDAMSNLTLSHWRCNVQKGSSRQPIQSKATIGLANDGQL
jgi:5-methylcytosine-specific restriction endonuclease McrA